MALKRKGMVSSTDKTHLVNCASLGTGAKSQYFSDGYLSDPVSEDRHLNGALDTNSQNAIGIEHQG